MFCTFSLSLEKAWFMSVIKSGILPEKICCLLLLDGPCHNSLEKAEDEITKN